MRPIIAAALAISVCCSVAIAEESRSSQHSDNDVSVGKVEISGPSGAAPHENDAGRLVMHARALLEEKGCAAAAPAFRVIASMGEGQESAQHELGECLLTLKGASEIETALFRQEGEFWLARAAFAGNARAQRKLAMEMASPASSLHDPKGALQWALVYAKNPTAQLYGYGPLPPTLVPGLKGSLDANEIAAAESFAAKFVPVMLAKFEGPKRETKGGPGANPIGPPPGGKRRGPGLSR